MDEVKIWAIDDDSKVVPLASKGRTESESLLEETLVKNPELLIPGLTLVGRQTPTEGGPLDLLGVDKDGRLVVFELKRGTLSRDAVAQVIDYASYLDGMALEDLANYISRRSGAHGIDEIQDFQDWYSGQDFGELESLKPLRLFLVGLGADDRTERMVRFLADNSGMAISLLTFHGFSYKGKTLLAKQVEVAAGTPPDGPSRKERLDRRAEEFGVRELFNAVRGMFRENWPGYRTYTGGHRLSIRLKEQGGSGKRAAYARIDPQAGKVRIVFYQRAKALCLDEFRQPVKEIRYDTWPKNRDPLEDPDTEIQFPLTEEDWETHKERLHTLTKAVYEAWESSGQDDGT